MIVPKSTYNLLAITAPKIHTDLLWDLSFLFIGLSVVYFLLIFIHKKRLAARLEKIKQRKSELSPMISEFLFYEEDASKEDKAVYLNLKIEIRQLIKNKFNRKVLSDVLLDLRKDLSGDTQKRLFELYQDLGLHKDAFKKLKSWRWQVASKAIQDLTKMQVVEAYSFITKFINDKRSTIRKQAEIATVTLKYEGINYFLDSTKYKISEWQQLKLLDVIRNQVDYKPPAFSAWLTSTNNHVVLFALRLIKFYTQNNANASLIELLKHKNANIKLEAIACIKEFYVVEALDTLKLVFWKSSTDIKMAILDAIGELGTEEDIVFLELIDRKISNFSIKSKALSSINAISPERILPTKDIIDASGNQVPDDLPLPIKEIQAASTLNPNEDTSNSDTSAAEVPNTEANNSEDVDKEDTDKEMVESAEIVFEDKELIEEQKEQFVTQTQEIDIVKDIESTSDLEESDLNSTEQLQDSSISTINLHFLPFVVPKAMEEDLYHPNMNSNLTNASELWVSFEEVKPSNKLEKMVLSNEKSKDTMETSSDKEIGLEDISFLPIVVENKEFEQGYTYDIVEPKNGEVLTFEVKYDIVTPFPINDQDQASEIIDYIQYNIPEILNLTTISEEVTVPSLDNQNIFNLEVTDPVFLSSQNPEHKEEPMNAKFNTETEKTQTNEEMTPQDEEKFKQIINSIINLEPENTIEEPASIDFDNETIDITFIPLVKEVTDADSTIPEDKLEENPEPKLKVPKAIISDEIVSTPDLMENDSEESTMQLLDDLEEMGDQREVPLLNEMLVNVKYKTVSTRVEKLIVRFTEDEEELSPIVEATENIILKPFNVFEDLFRVCDDESKLILLDEVAIVGDVDDVNFLEGLQEDKNMLIREKAERVLIELKNKLGVFPNEPKLDTTEESKESFQQEVSEIEVYTSLMEELEIETTSEPSGLFDIAFELEYTKDSKNQPHKTKSNQDSIMNQIYSFSNKIIDKFNG